MRTTTITVPFITTLITLGLLPTRTMAQTVGNWDVDPWNYSTTGSITTSAVTSDGPASVDLVVDGTYQVTGQGGSAADTNSVVGNSGGVFLSTYKYSWIIEPSGPSLVDFTTSRKLNFSQAIDFGSAADQSVGFGFSDPNNNGFGVWLDSAPHLAAGKLTLSLEGGAVFGASSPVSAPSLGVYTITGGGAGQNYMELTWDPLSGNNGKIYFNDINILGSVTGIEAAYTGAINRGFATAGTDNFTLQYNIMGSKATVVPEPSGLLLLSLGGLGLLARRRKKECSRAI
ncbi:MAG: PEP-CTERM sorting domain-containing protein [Chthoniobacterales bacterium]